MVSKVVALGLPEELIQAIELRAKAISRDKAELVIEILMQAFDIRSHL